MGNCCFNCDNDKLSSSGPTESDPLIPPTDYPDGGDHGDSGRSPTINQTCDEQSALNRILQTTATSIIDVTAIDSHNLEQHEYMDRAKHYNHRMASANLRSLYTRHTPCLLTDVPVPDRILTADLTSTADLQMIIVAADRTAKAMGDVKVEQKDDLVVQYGIP